jgi:hypothetical protein
MAADWNYDDDPADVVEAREPVERAGRRHQDHLVGMERPEDFDTGLDPEVPAADRPDSADDRWEWSGLELEAEANRIADNDLTARREAEGRDAEGNYTDRGITPAMRRIEAELEHGTLVPDSEKFALKSPDRFKEKLAKLIERRPDDPVTDLALQIHDGIRYTFLFDSDNYTDGVRETCGKLGDRGYEPLVLKNTWDSDEYKGINSRWLDTASGLPFEVQFHTPESWEAKQLTHEAYEKINDLRTTTVERERLRAYQDEISRDLQVPDRCQEIREYRKDGW